MLILVAEEQNLAVVPAGIGLDVGNAVQYSAFKIELHHDADGLGESGIHSDRKVERADGPLLHKP